MNATKSFQFEHIKVNPIGDTLGAQVTGVDLTRDIPAPAFEEIETAFAQWSVIVFRNQIISPADQLRFARRFGELEINAFDKYGLEGHPGILKVSNIHNDGMAQGYADAGSFWHSDMSYTPTPPRLTMLYALEIPKDDAGNPRGDTQFASATAAYRSLDDPTRHTIDGLRAIHSFSAKKRGVKKAVVLSPEQVEANPPVAHPVARVHPVTGGKAIYVTADECTGIENMESEEAIALIARLAAHIVKPEHQYHHKWQVNDVLVWDNCAVQHVVNRDYEWPRDRRMMHRVTVNGSVPY